MAVCWTILMASTALERATSRNERRRSRPNWVKGEAAKRVRLRRWGGGGSVAEPEAGDSVAGSASLASTRMRSSEASRDSLVV
eukprot:scaffold248419_cov28-Tisochrysis_lutea.AAC.3